MTYEDLPNLNLKQFEVPMPLSKKLYQLALGDDVTYPLRPHLLECAQHALALEIRKDVM